MWVFGSLFSLFLRDLTMYLMLCWSFCSIRICVCTIHSCFYGILCIQKKCLWKIPSTVWKHYIFRNLLFNTYFGCLYLTRKEMDQTFICLAKLVFYCLVSELLVGIFIIIQKFIISGLVYVKCENPRLPISNYIFNIFLTFLFSTRKETDQKKLQKTTEKL